MFHFSLHNPSVTTESLKLWILCKIIILPKISQFTHLEFLDLGH